MFAALSPAIAVLVLMLLVAPIWPYSRGWGWTWFAMLAMGAATIVLFTLTTVEWV